ncbi:MAG: hypothetical protein JWP87_4112 [Labilithrix sp.]|nr:hypothetical protein [Labilithrix sp.]
MGFRRSRARLLGGVTAAAALSLAAPADAAPTITFVGPVDGNTIGSTLFMNVTIDSASPLSSVVGHIGNVSAPLTKDPDGHWRTVVELPDVPEGPVAYTIAATDSTGFTETATIRVNVYSGAMLTIDTPMRPVARPCTRVRVTCPTSGVSACDAIEVLSRNPDKVLASAKATANGELVVLDHNLSLAEWDGQQSSIYVRARVPTGDWSSPRELPVYVDSSSTLVPVADVDGRILDFDDTRILFVGRRGVSIKARQTNVVTVLASGNPHAGVLLAPSGALWEGGEAKVDGVASNDVQGLRVAGTWATWTSGSVSTGRRVFRRDLTNATTWLVANGHSPDVDETGAIAYVEEASQPRVHLVPNGGVDEIVAADTGSAQSGLGAPRIGGSAITWEVQDSGGHPFQLVVKTPTGIDEMPWSTGIPALPPYLVRAGWVASVRNTSLGINAWTRSPAGVLAVASPLDGVDAITALEPDGTIAYDVVGTDHRRSRYFGGAGAAGPNAPVRIGAGLGRLVHRGADWYQIVEGSLYGVDTSITTPLPACGDPDPSTPPATNPSNVTPPVDVSTPPSSTASADDAGAGSCASSGGKPSSSWIGGVLVALGFIARRRRRDEARREREV